MKLRFINLLFSILLTLHCTTSTSFTLKKECWNWNDEMGCRGNQVDNHPDHAGRKFQTPLENTSYWHPSYQSLHKVVGHASIVYSPDRQSAVVTLKAQVNPKFNFDVKYSFNNEAPQDSNQYRVSNSFQNTLSLKIILLSKTTKKQEGQLELEPLNFLWQAEKINLPGNYEGGQKGAIVELFGWPFADIEKECEMLGKAGYLGVKVFPQQEAVLSDYQIQNGELNPWFWVYQPVSYKLTSRMGTRKELRQMIQTCRSHGVRVYADAVINHMTGGGNDAFHYHRIQSGGHCARWGAKNSTADSPYYTHSFAYKIVEETNQKPGLEFPAVPWGPLDFHCERPLRSWSSGFDLNYGWLVGLTDLNTEKENVQDRIADYLVDLLSIGFSGFRIDAAKHISPEGLAGILSKFKQKLGGGNLPEDFMTYLEVIMGGEKDLLMCNDNDYDYGTTFVRKMKQKGLSDYDIYRVKIWSSDYPKEHPICGYWKIPSERVVIQNDDHDQQFGGSSSRDMGDKGSVLVKERNVGRHRHFNKILFQRGDGNWKFRMILSSYTFYRGSTGFPDGLSDCKRCKGEFCNQCTRTMPYRKAYDPNTCGYDDLESNWDNGFYTRTHRDLGVVKDMRRWMGLNPNLSNEQLGVPSHCRTN